MALPFSSSGQQKVLFLLGAGIGLVVWTKFFFVPQCKTWVAERSKIVVLKQKLGEAHRKSVQLPGIETELASGKAQTGFSSNITRPPKEQLPELLEMIAQAARASQVKLLLVKPKDDFSQSGSGPTGFLEVTVKIEASAGYHQIGQFIDILEHSKNLVRVQGLKIQSDPKDLWNHLTILILQAYLLQEGDSSIAK